MKIVCESDINKVISRRAKLKQYEIEKITATQNTPTYILDKKISQQQLLGEPLEKEVFLKIFTLLNKMDNEKMSGVEILLYKNYIFNTDKNEIDLLIVFGNCVILLEIKDWQKANEVYFENNECYVVYGKKTYKKDYFVNNNKNKTDFFKSILGKDVLLYNLIYIKNDNITKYDKFVINDIKKLLSIIKNIIYKYDYDYEKHNQIKNILL